MRLAFLLFLKVSCQNSRSLQPEFVRVFAIFVDRGQFALSDVVDFEAHIRVLAEAGAWLLVLLA